MMLRLFPYSQVDDVTLGSLLRRCPVGFLLDHMCLHPIPLLCWDTQVFLLICISLMASDAEHFLMCLLAMSTSSLVKFLFMSFAHFMIGLFVSLVLSLISSLYILDTSPLSNRSFAKIFSHSVGCLLVFLTVSFAVQKLFILMKSQ